MKKLLLIVPVLLFGCALPVNNDNSANAQAQATPAEVARWQAQAQNITIIRDDWGVPHVYGQTDPDAVFGVMYAQAEDDFNRVEVNYMNAKIGRAHV